MAMMWLEVSLLLALSSPTTHATEAFRGASPKATFRKVTIHGEKKVSDLNGLARAMLAHGVQHRQRFEMQVYPSKMDACKMCFANKCKSFCLVGMCDRMTNAETPRAMTKGLWCTECGSSLASVKNTLGREDFCSQEFNKTEDWPEKPWHSRWWYVHHEKTLSAQGMYEPLQPTTTTTTTTTTTPAPPPAPAPAPAPAGKGKRKRKGKRRRRKGKGKGKAKKAKKGKGKGKKKRKGKR